MSSVFVRQVLYYHFDMRCTFFRFSAFVQKHFMRCVDVHLPIRQNIPDNISVLLQHFCLIIYCCFVLLDLVSFGASFVLRFSSEPIFLLFVQLFNWTVCLYIYGCICVCLNSLFINCIFPAVDFKLYTIISFACLQS